MIIVFLGVWLSALVAFVYMVARNNWVYRQQIAVLHSGSSNRIGLIRHTMLADYKTMFWRFWEWDVLKFVHPDNRAHFIELGKSDAA